MGFTVLPAIDVAAGRAPGGAVPIDLARSWQAQGASWLHLVDLDAARGSGTNAALLAAMVDALGGPVQLSGGIVDDVSLSWALSTGCARVVLATDALDDLAWCADALASCGDRIAVALDIDVGRGRLRDRGTGRDVGAWRDAVVHLDAAGCRRYVVTDVDRDGRLQGPNLELYRAITDATATPVLASGGVASLDDLVALTTVADNLDGAVVGHAIHHGRFTLAEALSAVSRAG